MTVSSVRTLSTRGEGTAELGGGSNAPIVVYLTAVREIQSELAKLFLPVPLVT
jgi:hypothetical protein